MLFFLTEKHAAKPSLSKGVDGMEFKKPLFISGRFFFNQK